MLIYKLLSESDWNESQTLGYVKPSAYDIQFIHMCNVDQIDAVLKKLTVEVVVILEINSELVQGKLVQESNSPGGKSYWHLYDDRIVAKKIPLGAVSAVQIKARTDAVKIGCKSD